MFSQPFFIPAIISLVVSLPLIMSLIPRNRFYGVRTNKTLSNDRIWYPANRLLGWLLIICSLTYLATTLLWPYSKSANDDFEIWLVHLSAFVIPLIISLFILSFYIRKL